MAFIPDEEEPKKVVEAPKEPEKPSPWSAVFRSIPPIAAWDLMNKGQEFLDRSAYKLGGAVTDAASKVLPPEAAAATGYVANVGMQAIPTIAGAAAGPAIAQKPMEGAGKWLMQSALKPDKASLQTGKAQKAIQTLLDEGVNVSEGGATKLRSEISRLNNEIMQQIANSPATVDKRAVASELQSAINKFSQQVTPQADLKIIQKAWGEFMSHPLLKNMTDIPVQLAQQLKQGTYKALGSKSFGELKGAEVEAQKTLARSLKEKIAQAVPGIEKLNARESELLNAEALVVARDLMSKNRDIMGLGSFAWMNPMTLIPWLADRSPTMKSLLARAMYSGSGTVPTTVGGGIGAAIGNQQGNAE